jgi:hypothetical protein
VGQAFGRDWLLQQSSALSPAAASRTHRRQLILRKLRLELGDKNEEWNTESFDPTPHLDEVEPSLTSLVLADFTLRDPKPSSQVALRGIGGHARFNQKAQQQLLLL